MEKNVMGMTNKQYQGFIRTLKELTEEKIEKGEKDENRTKEDVLNDLKSIKELLQSMLEDGN